MDEGLERPALVVEEAVGEGLVGKNGAGDGGGALAGKKGLDVEGVAPAGREGRGGAHGGQGERRWERA